MKIGAIPEGRRREARRPRRHGADPGGRHVPCRHRRPRDHGRRPSSACSTPPSRRRPVAAMAATLNVDARALEKLLNLLVATGYLTFDEGTLRARPASPGTGSAVPTVNRSTTACCSGSSNGRRSKRPRISSAPARRWTPMTSSRASNGRRISAACARSRASPPARSRAASDCRGGRPRCSTSAAATAPIRSPFASVTRK